MTYTSRSPILSGFSDFISLNNCLRWMGNCRSVSTWAEATSTSGMSRTGPWGTEVQPEVSL